MAAGVLNEMRPYEFHRYPFAPCSVIHSGDVMATTSTSFQDEKVTVTARAMQEAYDKFAREDAKRRQYEKDMYYAATAGGGGSPGTGGYMSANSDQWRMVQYPMYNVQVYPPDEQCSKPRHSCCAPPPRSEHKEYAAGLVDYYKQRYPDFFLTKEAKICDNANCLIQRIKQHVSNKNLPE